MARNPFEFDINYLNAVLTLHSTVTTHVGWWLGENGIQCEIEQVPFVVDDW